MKTYLKIVFALAFLFTFTLADAATAFPRYIQKGDEGSDVKLLQLTLNQDADTQVATEGPGAPGYETDYYGELTKQAVIKLQKKHGLGTQYGFFSIYSGALDEKTRAFLNSSAAVANITEVSVADVPSILNSKLKSAVISPTAPFIDSVEPKLVQNGDIITINGRNFSTSTTNKIRLTYDETSTTSENGTVLKIKARSYLQELFNKQSDGMTGDQKDRVKDKIPEIPLFITVQNATGISNAYQINMKIK